MMIKLTNPYWHIVYWLGVIVVLSLVFGASWEDSRMAFFFVSMLVPVVLGTSYFFNFFLVSKYYLKKQFKRFVLYSCYTIIVSLYFEIIVLILSYVYIINFEFVRFSPNASDIVLLAVVLYLLVAIGSILILKNQIKEYRDKYKRIEQDKVRLSTLSLVSNRKKLNIAIADIVYVESLVDHIKVHTNDQVFESKEKISTLYRRMPQGFLRIHRSFIINASKVQSYTRNEIIINDISLTISRSFQDKVKFYFES